MPLLTQWALTEDPQFLSILKVAICKVALDVTAELPATLNHAERRAFARLVLLDPEKYTRLLAFGVVTDQTLTKTEAAMLTRVAVVWDAYALSS